MPSVAALNREKQKKWQQLKRLSEKIDWENEEKRKQVRDRLKTLLDNESYWTPAPNLLDTFTARQIERLLSDHATDYIDNVEKIRFIERVAETGYRDQGPEVNAQNGETPPARVTPLHRAAKCAYIPVDAVTNLFKIYDKFEANYSDEDGYTHFHIACEFGCVDAVTKFLEAGQDPNIVKKKTGDTPLHMALLCWNYENKERVVKLLLEKGADPKVANAKRSIPMHSFYKTQNFEDAELASILDSLKKHQLAQLDVRNKLGRTPLHLALRHEYKNTAEVLLKKGADPNLVDNHGSTALHIICKNTFYFGENPMEWFFRICNDDGKTTWQVDAKDNEGRTPLHLAVLKYSWSVVETLLRRGADPNSADNDGSTPLHMVCKKKFYIEAELMRFFQICDGIDETTLQVDAKDNEGRTPLHLALLEDKWKLVEMLLRRGADSNSAAKDGSTALHIVCKDLDANAMDRFFEICDGVDETTLQVDAKDNEGRTPLHLALLKDKWKLVELLLRRGADPISADNHGSTTLHIISERKLFFNETPMKRFLRICDGVGKATLQVDAKDNEGRTPLYLALLNCNWSMVETLLRRGAYPNPVDNDASTPLHTFSKRESDVVFSTNSSVPTLIESGLKKNINALDNFGRAPLHWALSRGRADLVEWLLRNGADPNLGDEEGATPLHYICLQPGQGGVDSAKLFFEICQKVNQSVLVDAKDAKRRTPLQLAVLNLSLDLVTYLLDSGADAASFVFPDATLFADRIGSAAQVRRPELAWRAITIVERLELRGYRPCQRDATATMKLLDEYQVFVKPSTDLRQLCRDDKAFETKAKKFKFGKELPTLHELIHMPIDRRACRTLTSMGNKAGAHQLSRLGKRFGGLFDSHLCEILLRNFCLGWATDPFRALMHRSASGQAPLEVCQMIFEHLANQDLCNICLAAAPLPESNEAARSEGKSEDAKIATAPKRLRRS